MFKIIAMFTMLIDHIGLIFFPSEAIFRVIGRLSFPFFAYGIANGYSKTRNVYKYGQRLLILALISQPIYFLALDKETLNICWTLFLGLAAIFFYENRLENKFLSYFLLLLTIALTFFIRLDYGLYGILVILVFHIFKNDIFMIPVQIGLTLLKIVWPLFIQIFSIPAFFIIHYFKKYDFKINRYLQYSFYPLHLLILYLIKIF